jgi:hypothetical protein
MKKLISIIALCLICYSADARNLMVVGGGVPVAGATGYCTGAATCTETNPGQCDLLCEDFEGSTSCGSGLDSNCRNGWTAAVGANATLDSTVTHSGTLACTDKGTNSAQFSATNDSTSVYMSYDFGVDKPITYAQAYVNLVSGVLSDTMVVTVMGWYDSTPDLAHTLIIANVGGTLRLQVRYFDQDILNYSVATGSTTALSRGTWYRLRLNINTTAGTLKAYVNDTEEISLTDIATAAHIPRTLRIGSFYTYATHVFQVDNVAVDDDTTQGACSL